MKKILGVEFGSTRIKAVLTNESGKVLAIGTFDWENDYIDGHFTYPIEKVVTGLQTCYKEVVKHYGKPIESLDALGISAMMHGYLAFDKDWNLLVPFRTWRDTTTAEASAVLTEKLCFNMPQRWSSVHFYQAILNGEPHVKAVAHLTTLAGYVHFLLTGKNVLGADDASGVFPLSGRNWDDEKITVYNEELRKFGIEARAETLFPKVMLAGEKAGTLTETGAKLLDPSGILRGGAVCCPPEGDMGTGMIATNSVAAKTANISSGTAANMTVVLEKPMKKYYKEIDMIATPDGYPAALIHTNNCTTEINEWVNLFSEVAELCGAKINKSDLFVKLFNKSTESDGAVGKLVGYNYLAGEPLADTRDGAPMIVRSCDGKLNLANFMQMQIYSAISTVSLGTDILKTEDVKIERVTAHGGFYKTDKIGQIATSALLDAPVTIMQNASEGGAWGIALLAGYVFHADEILADYLEKIFAASERKTLMADESEKSKCKEFLKNYNKYLSAERLAAEVNHA